MKILEKIKFHYDCWRYEVCPEHGLRKHRVNDYSRCDACYEEAVARDLRVKAECQERQRSLIEKIQAERTNTR